LAGWGGDFGFVVERVIDRVTRSRNDLPFLFSSSESVERMKVSLFFSGVGGRRRRRSEFIGWCRTHRYRQLGRWWVPMAPKLLPSSVPHSSSDASVFLFFPPSRLLFPAPVSTSQHLSAASTKVENKKKKENQIKSKKEKIRAWMTKGSNSLFYSLFIFF
jgi:hypothetical protein